MTDAESIAELEEMLRQRDARIAELERIVGELSKVIEAWKRGHRVRPGGKISQKPRDKRRATGRGPGRPEGHEGTSRPAPTSADRDVLVPVPETCSCGGIIDPTGEEPGAHFVEELIPARKEVIRLRRCRGRCRDCKTAVLAGCARFLPGAERARQRCDADTPARAVSGRRLAADMHGERRFRASRHIQIEFN